MSRALVTMPKYRVVKKQSNDTKVGHKYSGSEAVGR
jgi:hypothetical protein